MRVTLTLRSGNEKTGPIPVSTTERASCPDSCSFKGRSGGCYAEGYPLRLHWDRVPQRGMTWADFCAAIAALPAGQLWRHNQAGDLPGEGDHLDIQALSALVTANAGKRGFTYTHKPLTRDTRAALADANLRGFTVNVSCDNLAQLDNIGSALPAVVVLPALQPGQEEPKVTITPAGNRVVTCPAQWPAQWRDTSCADCGLCARSDRTYAIGFRAHGQSHKRVSQRVSLNVLR